MGSVIPFPSSVSSLPSETNNCPESADDPLISFARLQGEDEEETQRRFARWCGSNGFKVIESLRVGAAPDSY